ncbi:Formimidoylglutamase [Gemmata sp. SH-PL17]|uniref:formimidoylglutamase n=1 Tax=Gemmata sp. SH-PL17 TaxID=1630693 RepID=UPI0004B38CAA|nr:formimidoylglutamase [Gemmata sp. SH-PL17]AMV24529.1 Formimidoylglutamase [Gemmata sp. SH-PL17]
MPEPDMSVWAGRVDTVDGPTALRWHQMVKPLAPDSPPGLALIGFACDEGVRRNGGRVGAKDGPRAIRKVLANFAWHRQLPVYDAGDVRCDDGDMEGAQVRLAEAVRNTFVAGHRPLVLGGGHETAWGTYQGLTSFWPGANVGIINVDAHFDLRDDEPGNSGTPFRQMADWCQIRDRWFGYMALGISVPSNTRALFDRACALNACWYLDQNLVPWNLDRVLADVKAFADHVDCLYLSIDLDVLPGTVMPAVSAPAARGVAIESVETIIDAVVGTGKLFVADVVELNPLHDINGQGARLAARLVWHLLSTGKPDRKQP